MNKNTKKISGMNDKELNDKFGVFGFLFSNGKPNFFEPAKFITNVKEMASNPKYISSLDSEEVFAILGWVKEFLGKNNFNGFNIDALRDFYCLMKNFYLYNKSDKPGPGEFTAEDLADLFRDLYVDRKELDLTNIKTSAEVFINKIKSSSNPKLRHNDIGLFSLMCENSMTKIIEKEAFQFFKSYALADDKIDADLALIMICNVRNDLDAENSFIDKLEINDKDGKVNPEYFKTVNDWNINSYSWYYLSDQPFGKKDEFESRVEKGALFKKLIYKLADHGCSNLFAKDVVPPDRANYLREYLKLAIKAREAAKNNEKGIVETKEISEMNDRELNEKFGIFGFSFSNSKLVSFSETVATEAIRIMSREPKYIASLNREEVLAILGWFKDSIGKNDFHGFHGFNGFDIYTLRDFTRLIKCGKEYGLCEWTYSSYDESSIEEFANLFRDLYTDREKLNLKDSEAFAKHFIDEIKPSVLRPDDIKTFFLLCDTKIIGRFDKETFDVFKNYALANGKIDANLALIMIGLADDNVLDMTEVVNLFIDKLEIKDKDGKLNPEYLNGVIKKFIVQYSVYYCSHDDVKANDNHEKKMVKEGKLLERLINNLAELGCKNLLAKDVVPPNRGNYLIKYRELGTKAIEAAKNKKIEQPQKDKSLETEIKTIVKKSGNAKTWIKDKKTGKLIEEPKETQNLNNDSKILQIPEIAAYYENKFNELKQKYGNIDYISDEAKRDIKKLFDDNEDLWKRVTICTDPGKYPHRYYKIVYNLKITQIEDKIKDILAKSNENKKGISVEDIRNNPVSVNLEAEKNMNGSEPESDEQNQSNLDDSVESVSTQDSIGLDESNDILNGFDISIYSQENTKALNSYLDKLNDEEKRDFLANQLGKVGESFDSNESLESIKSKLLNIAFIVYGLGDITLKKGEKLTEHPILREINEANNIEDLKLMFEAFNSDYGLGIDRFNFYGCSKKNTDVLESYLKKADDEQKIKLVAKMLNETEKSFKDNNKTLDAIKNELLNAIEVIYKLNSLPKEIGKSKQFLINQVNEASEIGVFELIGLALKNIVSLILGKTSLEKEESRLQKAKFQNVFGMIRDAKAETEKPKSGKDKSTSRSK